MCKNVGLRKVINIKFIGINKNKQDKIKRYIEEIASKQNKCSVYIVENSNKNNLINISNNNGDIVNSFYYSELKDF
jgi:hypothetical protein